MCLRNTKTSPQTIGRPGQEAVRRPRAAEVELPVDTFSSRLPVTPAERVSVGGLKVHSEFSGNALHEKTNVAEVLINGVRTSAKLAVPPAVTVWRPDPERLSVKSKPVPWSGTEAALARVEEAKVMLPVCGPADVGVKDRDAEHRAPGASLVPQVLPTSRNPAGTEIARLFSVSVVPELVILIEEGLLVWPTPVVGKLSVPGVIWIPPALAPEPLS